MSDDWRFLRPGSGKLGDVVGPDDPWTYEWIEEEGRWHITMDDFVLARVAEDDAQLSAASWSSNPEGEAAKFAHRLAADCAAKRKIVENEITARLAMIRETSVEQIRSEDGPVAAYWRGQDWVLRILAAVYADHPDYREEWRP